MTSPMTDLSHPRTLKRRLYGGPYDGYPGWVTAIIIVTIIVLSISIRLLWWYCLYRTVKSYQRGTLQRSVTTTYGRAPQQEEAAMPLTEVGAPPKAQRTLENTYEHRLWRKWKGKSGNGGKEEGIGMCSAQALTEP